MAGVGDLLSSAGFSGDGGFLSIIAAVFIGAIGLAIVAFFIWFMIVKRKKWNLSVGFKIPRNIVVMPDGSVKGTLNKEWGKGYYDNKKGVCWVKRKGKTPVSMKPFDIKRYLSSGNILDVIQVGMEDYRPVLDESYIEVVDDDTGEEAALVKTRIDTTQSKAWKSYFTREATLTYTIKSWLSQHGDKIAMGIVILLVLVGQAIVIGRLK